MKHLHLRCILVAAVATLSAVSSLADKTTNTYTKASSASSITWSNAGLPDVSTTAGKDISVKIDYADGYKSYQRLETPAMPFYLDSVIGGKWHHIYLTSGVHKYVTINDPTPFEGFWSMKETSGPRASGLYLPDNGNAGGRTIGSAFLRGRFEFGVATGCEDFLDYPFGLGMFEVNRSSSQSMAPSSLTPKGKLTVNRSPGPYSVALVRAGTLGLVGGEGDTSSPVPGAWVRLDASVVDSFTMSANGLVTTWSDADGKDVSASVENDFVNKPLRAEDSVTGKTIVNFRGRGGAYDTNFHGSRLVLSDTNRTDIAEVFFVFRENDPTKPAFLFDKAFPRNGTSNQLFSAWASLPRELAMGEFRLNGQAVMPDVVQNFSCGLNVVSASYRSGGGSVKYIAGKDGDPSVGGVQFAEILLYTNTLSAAERRHNNEYLMRKWLGYGVRDYGAVMLASGAKLSVESGTARVRELVLGSDSLTKDGAGNLEVETLAKSLTSLSVSGGAVHFVNTLAHPDNPQPAADPLVWFDAADSSSFETFTSNYTGNAGTLAPTNYTFITRWKDKRDNGYTLSSMGKITDSRCANGQDYAALPTLDTTVPTRPMVDLGPFYNPTSQKNYGWVAGASGLSTWLRLYKDGVATDWENKVSQGFVVFHKTDSRGNPINSSDYDLRNAGGDHPKAKFVNEDYASVSAISGHWTYDGTTVNPGEVSLLADGKTHLGAFLFADNPLKVNVLGADMNIGGNSAGGCKIAEVILYKRVLTEQERLDTERYLMAKWNCGTHPADKSISSVGTLTFTNSTPAVIDVDSNMSFGRIDRDASGAIVKKGSGSATVSVFDPNAHDVTAVTVEDGSLTLTCDPLADAWAHLDATRADSIVYTTTAGTNYVSRWKDISGHGHDATTPTGPAFKPTWHTVHLDADNILADSGREIPVVDMGEYYNYEQLASGSSKWPTNTASAMDFANSQIPLQEFYIVHADIDHWNGSGKNNYMGLLGYTAAGSQVFPFLRKDQAVMSSSAPGPLRYGYIGVNAETKSISFKPTLRQLNVYTIAATNQVTARWTLARRGQNQVGGQVLGEVILFQTKNTVERRNAITSMLLNKWRGQQSQTPLTSSWTLGSLSVANGSSLAVNAVAGFAYTATNLVGAGSITSACPILGVEHVAAGTAGTGGTLAVTSDVTIADDAVLDVYIGEDGSVGSVSVTGTLTVGGSGTVRVHIPEGVRPAFGVYDIVTATAFAGTPGVWTAEVADGTLRGTVTVGYDAASGKIRLNINPNGMVIIFW